MKRPLKGDSLRHDIGHTFDMGLDIVKDILSLFFLELSQAKQNIVVLVSLLAILGLFLLTSWVCLIWLFVLWLLGYHISLFAAVLITLGVNILFSLVIFLAIKKSRKNINFAATREELENLMEVEHD